MMDQTKSIVHIMNIIRELLIWLTKQEQKFILQLEVGRWGKWAYDICSRPSHSSEIHFLYSCSDNFPTLSANPTSRDHFAKKCAEIVEYYGFDGIDIDWGKCVDLKGKVNFILYLANFTFIINLDRVSRICSKYLVVPASRTSDRVLFVICL